MRKFLLFFLPVFLLFSSSFIPKAAPRPGISTANPKSKFSPQDWIVDEATAQRMVNYFANCAGKKCHRHQKQRYNYATEIDNYIKSMYDVINITLENARYDDEDVPRYRQARGLAAGNNQGDVSGYSTVLTVYKVKPKSSAGFLFPPAMLVYVDNATICPPPEVPPCD